jgi:hypothetical protein
LVRDAPSSCWGSCGDQIGQFSEVLSVCCEVKLFICAFGSSELHHADADVSFEMGRSVGPTRDQILNLFR